MHFITCPHCQGDFSHEPALAGQDVDCPECGKTFTMPAAPDPPGLAFDRDGGRRAEPWYYRFLEGYGKALLVLGLVEAVLCVIAALVVCYAVARGGSSGSAILTGLAVVVGLGFFLLSVLFVVALIQLALEAGRNLRAVRRLLERKD